MAFRFNFDGKGLYGQYYGYETGVLKQSGFGFMENTEIDLKGVVEMQGLGTVFGNLGKLEVMILEVPECAITDCIENKEVQFSYCEIKDIVSYCEYVEYIKKNGREDLDKYSFEGLMKYIKTRSTEETR
jgi:hypothetical protein